MIQYWSNRGSNLGRCRVHVDDKDYGIYNAFSGSYGAPVALFQLENLTAGEHVITVTVEDAEYPNTCEIDRFA